MWIGEHALPNTVIAISWLGIRNMYIKLVHPGLPYTVELLRSCGLILSFFMAISLFLCRYCCEALTMSQDKVEQRMSSGGN